jgi:hypothetical protein
MSMPDEDVIADQIAYYRARAPEYDEWWQREGSYDLGAGVETKWLKEVQLVDEALEAFTAQGEYLNWLLVQVGGLSASLILQPS